MTKKNVGLAWHVHHDTLVEWCHDYARRVAYIKRTKPKNEQATRLRLFRFVKNPPAAVAEAGKACAEARKAYAEARKAYAEARKAYDEAFTKAMPGTHQAPRCRVQRLYVGRPHHFPRGSAMTTLRPFYRTDNDGNAHNLDCTFGLDDRVLWVCDEGHWLAWEIPAGAGDRCPVVFHDADSEGRCVGQLKMPECSCGRGER